MKKQTAGGTAATPRPGMKNTQVSSSRGTPASTVYRQGDRDPRKGRNRLDPVSGAQVGVGKGLAHSNTRNSPGVQFQGGPGSERKA